MASSSQGAEAAVELLKVGELATRTGLSVRTLHHYDDIGLLSPAQRTPSGHRLYGEAEVRRLQQIASLRQLGLSLEEIGACLDGSGFTLGEVLQMQIHRIQEDIQAKARLQALLRSLKERLEKGVDVSLDDVTRTIASTVAMEQYYTPEQLQQLSRRQAHVGQERIQEAQQEWMELFEAYQDAMDRGLDPASEEVRGYARRSEALIDEFTGGDPAIRASLGRMYEREGGDSVMGWSGTATEPGLWDYMGRAARALREGEGTDG